jgi:hypothetical protein
MITVVIGDFALTVIFIFHGAVSAATPDVDGRRCPFWVEFCFPSSTKSAADRRAVFCRGLRGVRSPISATELQRWCFNRRLPPGPYGIVGTSPMPAERTATNEFDGCHFSAFRHRSFGGFPFSRFTVFAVVGVQDGPPVGPDQAHEPALPVKQTRERMDPGRRRPLGGQRQPIPFRRNGGTGGCWSGPRPGRCHRIWGGVSAGWHHCRRLIFYRVPLLSLQVHVSPSPGQAVGPVCPAG